ncbi:hypothetical protein CDN99_03630 [Roseateles aquatilis]|uniref:Uncharacterized protein n=2 Tax=Roseateles aquatilis TaxID=431061 RepID=A0A246JLV4_9BURK|nr:hypothetical protein CDN99_03630 [Roseateles aquatilis]
MVDTGLGDGAEEITFGMSEREEIETHDEDRDARELKAERVEGLMRIEHVRELMRQIAGQDGYAQIRQRAERFATLWVQGRAEDALDEVSPENMPSAERFALMRLALEQMKTGPEAERLEAHLRRFETDAIGTVRRLVAATDVATGGSRGGAQRADTHSPLHSLLLSPLSPKLVLDTASALGPDGLSKLEAQAIRRSRGERGVSPMAEVGLSVALLRTMGLLREVGRSGSRLMKAGGCVGADDAEEVRKVSRWILDTTSAPSPLASLGRMSTVMKINGDARTRTQRQMLIEVQDQLPMTVWISVDAKSMVETELRNANTEDLVRRGVLNRAGPIRSRL